jgi:hypothetical protein
MGGQVAIEDNSYKTWQRSGYGARMLLTTPGMVKARIAWESKILGGSFTLLDQSEHCLSQYCLCGNRSKKPRGQEWHSCQECGLGLTGLPAGYVIHRDLYSAFLARLVHGMHPTDVQEHSVVALHAGELSTGAIREQCLSLCVLPYAELRDEGHAHQTILVPLARAGEQNRASRPTTRVPEEAPLVSESSVQLNAALVPHTGNTLSRPCTTVEPGTSVASFGSRGCRRDNPEQHAPEGFENRFYTPQDYPTDCLIQGVCVGGQNLAQVELPHLLGRRVFQLSLKVGVFAHHSAPLQNLDLLLPESPCCNHLLFPSYNAYFWDTRNYCFLCQNKAF